MKQIKLALNRILKMVLSVKPTEGYEIGNPKSFLIVRQHNQLGDLLVSTPMLRAIKNKFPEAELTAIVSPQNYKAYEGNPYLKNLFVFDKHKLLKRKYFRDLKRILKKEYDVAVVPSITSISFTSNLLARLSNSNYRIGVKSLNGKSNSSYYFFDKLVELDWRDNENTHASSRNLAILEPFGINTNNFKIIVNSNETDSKIAKEFIDNLPGKKEHPVIGLHVGAGKIQNRWCRFKFAELIERLMDDHKAKIYLTRGSKEDDVIIETVNKNTKADLIVFTKQGMPVLKEVIKHSDLFITNDTGPMHSAAATDTATISLFGPTNPHMWAPIGNNKKFIWRSTNIDHITVNEVYESAIEMLS